MRNLDSRVRKAVREFWQIRGSQSTNQGSLTGRRDTGNRTAATGGKQLDGFLTLFGECLVKAKIPRDCIFTGGKANVTLPGFFRPTKQWDLLVVSGGQLLAAIETKSLCGPSFGNNFNNRVEEALGSSSDIWTAYREGAFDKSPEPFVGYFMLIEQHKKSTKPVPTSGRHFAVDEEFTDSSYIRRCDVSIRRMVRERCYSAAALIVSNQMDHRTGKYSEPGEDLAIDRFIKLLCSHVSANYSAS